MSYMKQHAEEVSESMGLGGEITDVVLGIVSQGNDTTRTTIPRTSTLVAEAAVSLFNLGGEPLLRQAYDAIQEAGGTAHGRGYMIDVYDALVDNLPLPLVARDDDGLIVSLD